MTLFCRHYNLHFFGPDIASKDLKIIPRALLSIDITLMKSLRSSRFIFVLTNTGGGEGVGMRLVLEVVKVWE